MLDILICHAPQDASTAEAIAARLEACAEVRPWLEPCVLPDRAIPDVWDRGMASAAIIALLSPDSVRARVQRDEWADLLEHFETNETPPVACIKLSACAYPKILERRRFFTWTGDGFETLRDVERWAIGLHPPAPDRLDLAPIPGFTGRDLEIDALFAALADAPGQAALLNAEPASGKTALAQEFARRASRHFREIYWAYCGENHPERIHNDLRDQAGTAGFLEHRVLVVLDNVTSEDQLLVAPSKASILVTSRLPKLRSNYREFHIESSAPPEPASVDGPLLETLRACGPHNAALSIAAKAAGLFEENARSAAGALIEGGHAVPFDLAGKRIRLSHPRPADPSREAALAETVADAVERWRLDGALAADALPEANAAIEWGFANHWPLAVRLSQCLFTYLRARNRDDEARRVMERLAGAAESRGDDTARQEADWELSWMASGSAPPQRAQDSGQQLTLDF